MNATYDKHMEVCFFRSRGFCGRLREITSVLICLIYRVSEWTPRWSCWSTYLLMHSDDQAHAISTTFLKSTSEVYTHIYTLIHFHTLILPHSPRYHYHTTSSPYPLPSYPLYTGDWHSSAIQQRYALPLHPHHLPHPLFLPPPFTNTLPLIPSFAPPIIIVS